MKIFNKNSIYNIIISILIVIVIFLGANFGENKTKNSIDDSMRHYKYSQIIVEKGINETYKNHSWGDIVENSILSDYKTDLWQGHHILLSFISKLGFKDLEVNKFFFSLVLGLFIFVFLSYSSSTQLPFIPSLLVLLILLDPFGRFVLARPFMLTSLFFTLVIITLIKKKYIYLFIIFLIGSFYHMLFYMLFVPVGLYLLLNLVENKKILWKIIIYSITGAFFGILFHYNSIDYFILSAISFFYVPILHFFGNIGVSELMPSKNQILINIPFFFIIFVYIIIYFSNNKKIPKFDFNFKFIILLLLILSILSVLISRFSDFLFPIQILFLILIINLFYKNIDGFKEFILKYNKNRFKIIFTILLIIILGIESYNTTKQQLTNIYELKPILAEIKEKIPEGSNILSFDPMNFIYLFYFLGENYKYTGSMELQYLYMKDKNKFQNLIDYLGYSYIEPSQNIKNLDPYRILKSYNVEYIIYLGNLKKGLDYKSLTLQNIQIEDLNNDKRFELIYKKGGIYLWKLNDQYEK